MNIKCKANNKSMSAKRRAINANRRRRVMAANNGNASVSKIKKFIEDSVNSLQTSDYTNSRLILDDDLCLYVGYAGGFDTKDGYAICAKIAERNDADWADFDYLNMPWNTYSDNDGSTGVFEGDVYDTDIEITPGEDYTQDAQWLADSYVEIRNLLDEGKLTINSSCGKKSIKSSRRKPVKASYSSMRSVFQSFLGKVDKEVSDALYQYGDARWDVKGTMSSGDGSYWFELNLWCDDEEAGTVNIEVNGDTYNTNTDAYVVSTDDSDEIQAEGKSFDDIYDTCVGELIRLAEDYENFVRTDY